ncbi:MAG: Ser-Thr-rich GPI-anchored membrane family protein [Bacteroidota bacterium]|nr:Ser-Thr-rich GPI-anchored membrane family protein [Bacteroidota bacterium]
MIIQLWKNGAKEYNIAENVEGSTYNWTIPADQTKADDYQIRVKSSANASISDYSDSDFEITGMPPGSFITVIQPNGGESWEIGSAYLISWTDNISGNVGLELVDYSQTPTTFTTIATDVPGSTYTWTITDGVYDVGDDYKIKIYAMDDPTLQDKSDDYFSIVPDMMFSVHPNPVNQTMTLDLTKMNEGMYDAVLYNQFNLAVIEDTFKAGEIVQINTTNLPNGLYFLMLKTADGMKSQKIIVQH